MKITLATLCLLVSSVCFAQQNTAKPVEEEIKMEGYRSVPNHTKGEIIRLFIAKQQPSIDKKQATVLKADSVKGILILRKTTICSYPADTTFNGKVLKNAVMKKEQVQFKAELIIGDNIFTYRVFDVMDSKGKLIKKNSAANDELISCAYMRAYDLADRIDEFGTYLNERNK